ncbi:GerMN domain-containing protein [Geomonas sp. RF6]|uniref:GerMN domain-containing protein n=1 Tax=Geomonas sp. RF6 TaxID=2897342 RepID=UPI001E28F06E|nr:GerMN domain-containing protein [Geomonas sp. RF6]UFS70961.1 GerMN domain-containing protein [Geomonas sp. RF6]
MKRIHVLMTALRLLSILLIPMLLLTGCSRKDAAAPTKPVRVSATKAFEEHFGPAPTTDKGSCYAFVIFFPSAKDPAKAVPFPFFTFDQASLKKVAVQRLMGGMADLKSYQGELLQPFPPGTRLLSVEEGSGVVTVNFSPEVLRAKEDDAADRALVNAVVLTFTQFEGVKTVRIQVEGKDSRLSQLVKRVDQRAVLPLPPPRLLSVTAMKEKGDRYVGEVNAFFDRPVDIKLLQMTAADGSVFHGDIYHSVFDMAAVLKPKDPSLFKAGMPVRVRWQVVDKKGRASEGSSDLLLEVKEH